MSENEKAALEEKEALILKRKGEFKKTVNRIFVNWIGWKVLLPLLLISSIYLLIRFILEIPSPFGRAFAHGDLMIFSALVLLEAASEGEHVHNQSTMMDIVRIAAKIAAILFIGGFVATKADILNREFQLATAANEGSSGVLAKKMLAYSCLNWTIALVSVVSSVLIFWFNVQKEKTQEYEGLSQN